MGISAPTLLTADHEINAFQCGIEELDTWLRKQALKSQKRGTARVYVVNDTEIHQVIGYYAIAMGSVSREQAFSSLRRNSPDPIPMVILARLGVDNAYQGQGIAAGLLKDCIIRSVQAMNAVGGAGILVHAIDGSAQTFYKKFGFKESTFDPLVLMARICDIEKSLSID
ncbi:GNAT family N-acetyltransferase [Vibrio parahaemolyticus]|uniref:GNAT family N-acetyltransferase n=1 Tax=Vibrio parahaemolyticus TaxID=670 RepID=UPI00186A77FD|nr:GNAT family N-acetyltransferase [Vibrio parahaemolyticus]MBE4271111.1 GNAT family N-acetyltransferase [Vibrio parahaemolyticus]MBE4275835.1 GNAT family N-acetyltransferase [Vibrio parahaemolyticus]MCZ6286795.1 GNAT family N-acetyltransferase [Vibrio parahaemolyticus]MDF5185666.1 GNAT family N-acetyltransferase [Vibrio parahaemolyticus]MDF5200270.1 GNAT family N-acetyltransferase [Vibrio parahaemolyticus]